MTELDFEKVARELPADLMLRLRAGDFHKVAGVMAGVPDLVNEHALFAKVGQDLLGRLQERRRVVGGLLHLKDLGA